MAFDIEGARKAGYSDAEIAAHLASSSKFDVDGARKAGYSDAEIVGHLSKAPATPAVDAGAGRLDRLRSPQGQEMVKREAASFLSPMRGVKDVLDTGAELLARGYDKITGADEPNLSSLVTRQPQGEYARVKAMNDAGKREFSDLTSDSYVAPFGRIVGNAVATAPVGGALAAPLRGVAPRLANAMASGGFRTGAAPVGFAARAGDMGVRMAGGGITGGAAAGLIDPDSAGVGAGVGMALPPLAFGFGSLGRGLSSLTPKGGRQRAVEQIAEEIGPGNVRQAVGDMQTYYPRGAESIPVSSAAATQSPALARLEQGSRLRASPVWNEWDQKQGRAIFDNVLHATDEAAELGSRKTDRADNWLRNWQATEGATKPRVAARRIDKLRADIETAAASDWARGNKTVMGAVNEVREALDPSNGPMTLGLIQQLRSNMNGKVNPQADSYLGRIDRSNPAFISLKKELDEVLNTATGGKWQKALEGYAKDSDAVHASKAALKVRESWLDSQTGRTRGVSLDQAGDVPKITEAGLGRAMDAARLPDKSLALSQAANQRLEATLEAIRRQNILQSVKRTATGGGGSDTMSNAVSLGLGSVAPSGITGTVMRGLLDAGRRAATGRVDDAMAGLLSSPDDLAAALDALLARQPSPLLQLPYGAAPVLAADRQ